MGLFIADSNAQVALDIMQAQLDIIAISKIDEDIGFEESAPVDIEGISCIPVTYTTQNSSGPTPDRLNDLVNEVTYTTPDIIVIAATTPDWTLDDGSSVLGNGFAYPVGSAGSPFANNVCTVYDTTLCDGDGMWVDKEGGGTTCMSTSVLLYHELSHCFHYVTGTTAPTSAEEEVAAEIDENDMRDVRGLDHRDVDSHDGGCGCSGGSADCCIVASLSSGSALSDEVTKFRHLREHILRRSEVGDDFFKHFFYHYYAFSPEVTHLIGSKPNLSPLIKDRFVMPLLAGVELLVYYAENNGKGPAEFLRGQSQRDGLRYLHQKDFLETLSAHLRIAGGYDEKIMAQMISLDADTLGDIPKLLGYINRQTIDNEFIKWPLIDVVEVWVMSALLLHSGKSDAEIDPEIYKMISGWIGYMPITYVWEDFSRLQTEMELDRLEQFIFDADSKSIFAKRLAEVHPKYSQTIHQWANKKRRDA